MARSKFACTSEGRFLKTTDLRFELVRAKLFLVSLGIGGALLFFGCFVGGWGAFRFLLAVVVEGSSESSAESSWSWRHC